MLADTSVETWFQSCGHVAYVGTRELRCTFFLFFWFLVSLITRGIAHSCGFSVFRALVAQLPSTKRSALELYLMGEKWFVCIPCQS